MRKAPFRIAASVLCVALAAGGIAQDADAKFYRAYFLETEESRIADAAALYEEVVAASGASEGIVAKAKERLALCREDLRASDLARLAPPDALAYVEIRRPGEHLVRIVEALGLTDVPPGSTLPLISPKLLADLRGLEGAAMAITDVQETRTGGSTTVVPTGIAVLNPGRDRATYGLIETLLSIGLQAGQLRPGDAVHGYPAFVTPFGTIVLTGRLALFGSPHQLVVDAVERLEAEADDVPSLAASTAFRELAPKREGSLGLGFVEMTRLLDRVKQEAAKHGGLPREYQMAQAITDLESLRWVAMTLGSCEQGLEASLIGRLSDENRAVAYHLLRTPPVGKDALRAVPAGIAGCLAFGLGEEVAARAVSADLPSDSPKITGLDLGREVFANIQDVFAFVLPEFAPSASEGGSGGPPMPQVGVVMTVKDPARSRALWTTLLGIGAVVAGVDPTPVRTEAIEGRDVNVYAMPESMRLFLAVLPDRVVVANARDAISKAIQAADGKPTLLDDAAFALPTRALSSYSSKILLAHAGRIFSMARPFIGMPEAEAEAIGGILEGMTIAAYTDETPVKLQASVVVTIPGIGPMVPAMISRFGSGPPGRWAPPPASVPAVKAIPAPRATKPAPEAPPPVQAPEVIEPPPAPPVVPVWDAARTKEIVAKGSSWKFLDDGSDQGTAWRSPGFDDTAWKSGAAPLGYGDEVATEVGFGPDEADKHVTTYLRRTFEVDDPDRFVELRVLLRRDDGAAVYLNGAEVVRDNLAPDAGARDVAPGIVSGDAESHFFAFAVPAGALAKGSNTLAVEVHQSNSSSSDVIFDLAIEGLTRTAERKEF